MVGGLPALRRVGTAAGSNRRIRKTVRPVVWEGAGAQSPGTRPDRRERPRVAAGGHSMLCPGTACCQVPRHRFQAFTRHGFHSPFQAMGAARAVPANGSPAPPAPTRVHTGAESAPRSCPAANAPGPPILPPTPRSQTNDGPPPTDSPPRSAAGPPSPPHTPTPAVAADTPFRCAAIGWPASPSEALRAAALRCTRAGSAPTTRPNPSPATVRHDAAPPPRSRRENAPPGPAFVDAAAARTATESPA